MGERVSASAVVEAPIDAVWETIADVEAYPDWTDGVIEAQILETTEDGYPERAWFRVDARVAQLTYTLRYSYVDYDVHWELVEAETISQLDGSYELWEDGAGTGVRYTLEMDVDLPIPGFMKKRAARQIIDQGLHGLKQRVEQAV